MRHKPGISGHIARSAGRRPTVERGLFRGVVDRLQGRGERRPPDDDIAAALARLSSTEDGAAFLQWIHDQTYGHVPASDAEESALRESAALNRFATKIFALVDRGLARKTP